ncbi:DUF3426 domain-containing protein [Pseudohongiella spirulinae]|uniref:DUF3426 domain-containing protein n=1 Tax=Pseudohongiella spirulinae TaxID=1249552 RepID=A0A0S2KA19_9GAMM|nr:DUF3426 domain-containing protein [Pseudohongiella spirulinae]ALO45195.1 hypothetical protein PS2015_509 [Pseudohongiella spirulinae]
MWTLIEAKTPADELPHLDEPLQLSADEKPIRSGWRTTGLLILILVLVTSLFGQLSYFYQQQILAQATSRAIMSYACELVGCALPPLSDPSRIQVTELKLNDHPDYRNITVLTLSMQNRADFAQPLPDMILQFTSPQGDPIAGRQFSARHYVADRTPDNLILGAGELISAELAFASPGDDAINYQLSLIEPAELP